MRACAAATVALILALASCGSSGLRGRQLQAWGPHLRCQGFAEVGARGGTPLGLGAMKLRGGAKDEGVLGTSSATKGEASIGGDSFNMKEKNLWEEEADEVLGRASWEDGFSSGDGEEQGEEEDDGEDDEDDDTGTRAWFERMRKESQQTYEVPEDLVHVEETGLEGNMTSLMAALDNGANVSSVDLSAESRTALFYACTRFDDSAAVQTLLEAGADPNHEDTVGCRPLHFASEVCAPKIVELLINAGAERNVQNLFGNTPWKNVCMLEEFAQDHKFKVNPDAEDPDALNKVKAMLYFEGAETHSHWPDRNQQVHSAPDILLPTSSDEDEGGWGDDEILGGKPYAVQHDKFDIDGGDDGSRPKGVGGEMGEGDGGGTEGQEGGSPVGGEVIEAAADVPSP